MTERIATETDRLWTRVVQPWQTRDGARTRRDAGAAREGGPRRGERRKTLERQEEREARALTPSLANQRSEMEGAGVGATEDEMDVDDGDVEALREEDSWEAFDVRRAAFQARLYAVKRDVTQVPLQADARACFLSTKDAATLPAGYKAMNAALEEGVRKRGGTASMAFHGKGHCLPPEGPPWCGAGLQEWMRQSVRRRLQDRGARSQNNGERAHTTLERARQCLTPRALLAGRDVPHVLRDVLQEHVRPRGRVRPAARASRCAPFGSGTSCPRAGAPTTRATRRDRTPTATMARRTARWSSATRCSPT